jgi:hypothetical protein
MTAPIVGSMAPTPYPALVSTLHDPMGLYLQAIRERGHMLAWYPGVYVSATDSTDPRVIEALRTLGAVVRLRPERDPGAARLESLKLGMVDGHRRYLYCDFDRWLHWMGYDPIEARAAPVYAANRPGRPWFVCIGRTVRAFKTHPEVQQLAERATSRALELVIGRKVDATAGSSWMSREAAEIIAKYSTEPTMGTDLEWPALVWRHDPTKLEMTRAHGLEFETAEFAPRVAEIGLEAWMAETYDTPAMWRMRFQLATDSIAALDRVLRLDLPGAQIAPRAG